MWIGFSVTSFPWIGRCTSASCVATHHHGALSTDCHEKRTEARNLLRADLAVRRLWLGRIKRQIRAAHHTQLHTPIDQQRKTHGVLAAAQKPLGSIDRVKRPEPCIS